LLVLAAVGGTAAGLWALRPTPTFSSADVTEISPFDVTFRVENKNPWLDLSNLKISCVLAQVRASPISPTMVDPAMVDATNVRLAGNPVNSALLHARFASSWSRPKTIRKSPSVPRSTFAANTICR
jgi:hypothetical protein